MIKVTVEIWKYGDPTQKKIVGIAYIRNMGTGTPTRGNYKISFIGKQRTNIKNVEVKGFPRKSYTVWKLLYRALRELFK